MRRSLRQKSAWLLLWLVGTSHASTITLTDNPIPVTATFNDTDVGIYFVRLAVNSAPISQLVETTLRADSQRSAEQLLRRAVRYQAPYLLVHASCGGSTFASCERAVVFRINGAQSIRLGEVISSANVIRKGHFVDVYDKLDFRVDGMDELVPSHFALVLDDSNNALVINPELTWQENQALWRSNAQILSDYQTNGAVNSANSAPDHDVLRAATINAALARYCGRQVELQDWLSQVEAKLSTTQRRTLSDALSLVIPNEAPSQWRRQR